MQGRRVRLVHLFDAPHRRSVPRHYLEHVAVLQAPRRGRRTTAGQAQQPRRQAIVSTIKPAKTELRWPGKYNADGDGKRSPTTQPAVPSHRDDQREAGEEAKNSRFRAHWKNSRFRALSVSETFCEHASGQLIAL